MATTDRLLGLTGGVAIKASCVVASTTNLTLSSTQVVDSIVVGADERVLVKDQTDTTKNGIYVASSGSWSRAKDFNGSGDAIPGTLGYVDRGTANGRTFWAFNSSSTADAIDIGTTQVTVSQVTQALSSAPLTTLGDLLTHDGASAVRLGIGSTTQLIASNSSSVVWIGISALGIALVGTVNAWTASQSGQVTALSDGANIALDLSLSNNFSVTLAGNRQLDNPSNEIPGTSGVIVVTQDGGGSNTLSFDTQYEFTGGTAPTLTTTGGATDVLYYYVEAADKILISSALDFS